MNIQIDAKGKQCPLPVIEAKNAISGMTEAGIVEVTVDNEIAVQNLTKMADHKGLKAKSEKKSDQEYTVWMEVTEEFVKNNIKDGMFHPHRSLGKIVFRTSERKKQSLCSVQTTWARGMIS